MGSWLRSAPRAGSDFPGGAQHPPCSLEASKLEHLRAASALPCTPRPQRARSGFPPPCSGPKEPRTRLKKTTELGRQADLPSRCGVCRRRSWMRASIVIGRLCVNFFLFENYEKCSLTRCLSAVSPWKIQKPLFSLFFGENGKTHKNETIS